eukprot:scaffold14521_cov121-Isochrysis_galbana.AAC.3
MEQLPADARAAPSASGPTDMATETPPSPKRPRDPTSDNKVSQGAITSDPVWPERQIVTTENLSTAPANACQSQSLAHPTTLMGRWLKSVECWVLLCEGLQSRSTTTLLAVRLKRSDNHVCLAEDHLCWLSQSFLWRGTRDKAHTCLLRQPPLPKPSARRLEARKTPQQTAHDPSRVGKRQTACRLSLLTTATLTKCPILTPPLPPHSQGKNKPPPRPPPIAEEAMEEGDDPNFVSDTNNLITIKQKGPTIREIRDTDMGAAITYLLLDLEGVDTEPDILDDGKKGPWTIFATAECAEQFKGKYA